MKVVAISRVQQIVLAAILLTCAGQVIGHIAIFYDTVAYLRQGEYLALRLHLAQPIALPATTLGSTSVTPDALARFGPNAITVAGSRSAFYGLPLYLLTGVGSLWFVALLQGLVTTWLLRLTCRITLPDRETSCYWLLVTVLTVGSSLPYFVDFIMPDIFAGLEVLAVALVLVAGDRTTGREKLGLCALLTAAMLFHRSHVALLVAMVVAGIPLLVLRRHSRDGLLRGSVIVLCALLVVLVASAAYQSAFERDTGYAPGRPPFLMARILLDGPGKAYLDAKCPDGASPTLCGFKDEAMRNLDEILWFPFAFRGVFGSADFATRRKLQQEELPFVLASIRFDPGLTLRSALANWWTQLSSFAVVEPMLTGDRLVSPIYGDLPGLHRLMPGLVACDERDCRAEAVGTMVSAYLIQIALLAFSLLAMGMFLIGIGRAVGDDSAMRRHVALLLDLALLIIIGILANAAVCGILSGPFNRYEARVIWLVPTMGTLGGLVLFHCRSRNRARVPCLANAVS